MFKFVRAVFVEENSKGIEATRYLEAQRSSSDDYIRSQQEFKRAFNSDMARHVVAPVMYPALSVRALDSTGW
jgi:hypothetical protein